MTTIPGSTEASASTRFMALKKARFRKRDEFVAEIFATEKSTNDALSGNISGYSPRSRSTQPRFFAHGELWAYEVSI